MTNDAKFGLVVGLGLVIAIAVVYFHKDPNAKADGTPTAVGAARTAPAHGQYRPEWAPPPKRGEAPGQTTSQRVVVAGPAEPRPTD